MNTFSYSKSYYIWLDNLLVKGNLKGLLLGCTSVHRMTKIKWSTNVLAHHEGYYHSPLLLTVVNTNSNKVDIRLVMRKNSVIEEWINQDDIWAYSQLCRTQKLSQEWINVRMTSDHICQLSTLLWSYPDLVLLHNQIHYDGKGISN